MTGVQTCALPILAAYLAAVEKRVAPILGAEPLWVFGHLGDGNLHVITSLANAGDAVTSDHAVYEPLMGFGSVSAEHGIGVIKRDWLHASRNEEERKLMQHLKSALDPLGILNPGRIL